MSLKPYLFRVRTVNDVKALEKYINALEGAIYLEFFYRCKKKIKGFEKDDYVAAIAVDRRDLGESLFREGKVSTRHYFLRLEEVPTKRMYGPNKINVECMKPRDMYFSKIDVKKNWSENILRQLK